MNLNLLTDDDLRFELRKLTSGRRALQAELRRRERAKRPPKPKPRKVESAEEREQARRYAAFREEHQTCWACGRGWHDRPQWWDAPWLPNERAHVVNQTRVESIQAIVCLCSLCHKLSHNERIAGCDMPPLTKANLLYLLMQHTAVDWDFLRKRSVGALPAAEELPVEYLESQSRFGVNR